MKIVVATLVLLVYAARVNSSTINTCCDVAVNGGSYFSTTTKQPGVYNITDPCVKGSYIRGYCDTTTDGGGWLVILKRYRWNDIDFHRFWTDYERGFGYLYNRYSAFWYGLRSLHCLTSKGTWELRIDFTFANRTKSYLHYKQFKVGPATDNYTLSISGFTGITPTDPFATHPLNGQPFSTRDRDNDGWSGNCADKIGRTTALGGWWYNRCFHINLNYRSGSYGFMYLAGTWYTPYNVEMKIRPIVNCGR